MENVEEKSSSQIAATTFRASQYVHDTANGEAVKDDFSPRHLPGETSILTFKDQASKLVTRE